MAIGTLDDKINELLAQIIKASRPRIADAMKVGYFGQVSICVTIQDGVPNHLKVSTEQTARCQKSASSA